MEVRMLLIGEVHSLLTWFSYVELSFSVGILRPHLHRHLYGRPLLGDTAPAERDP